ncbi:MAG: cysteine hydrolase family protein [Pedobacter sp.]
MSNNALIVVDLQKDYYQGGKWTLEGTEKASANAKRILEATRKAGDLVVHVRHEFPNEAAPFFVPGSEGASIHPDVVPAEGEPVLTKDQVNSFKGTELKKVLDKSGIEAVTIVGAMSHMCIDAVTRAASDHGYKCTLVHDACATLDLEFNGVTVPAHMVHAAFMSALGFAYAEVISTEELLAR